MKLLDRPMTFNQFIFAAIAIPICYSWLLLANVLIIGGYLYPEIMTNIDKYITVLALLTAPATMIVFQITKTWAEERKVKQEEKEDRGISQHGVSR